MGLYFCSLNSGSNGNCYYIGNETDAILVDAGISCRETEKRMKKLGLGMDRVRAIFISHEHGDHISGLAVLAKKFKLPVYITQQTQKHTLFRSEIPQIVPFTEALPVKIGSLTITPFRKYHDAIDPHSFVIEHEKVTVGVFTDIGKVCERLVHYFSKCNAAFLEANYDADMLENGNYPIHLKNRIRGGEGHLSNAEALQLFRQHRPSYMSHLLLSHLSKNNNTPELVEKMFKEFSGGAQIIIASRYHETDVYQVNSDGQTRIAKLRPSKKKHEFQLSLFSTTG